MQNATPIPQAPVADPAGLRILLVDDSDADRMLMAAFLRPVRCTIDFACNGELGVALFRASHYDLVLMDYQMPVMTGPDAAREIRRLEKESGALPVPILAFTAHTLANVAVKAYEAGITELLSKPIRREVLLAAVEVYGTQPMDAASALNTALNNDIEELIPAYLDKRLGDVSLYRTALQAGDFDAVRKLGHKMKGTGSGYGFPRLTQFGADIEDAATRSDASALQEQLGNLALYLDTERAKRGLSNEATSTK
jgi:CheY-like chemotaxis protein